MSKDELVEVRARERCITDIGDINAKFDGIGDGLANKLITPLHLPNLIAVTLAILENLKLFGAAIGIDTNGKGDQIVLADHLLDHE